MDLSNYAMKDDLKGATGLDTSMLASKTDLVDLKTNVDDVNVDKLKTVPADVSKLGNGVDNGVKKTIINWLLRSMLLMLRHQTLVY